MPRNIKRLFTHPTTPRQRQYEALRAVAFGEGTMGDLARRFGYSSKTLRTLVYNLRAGTHELFPAVKPGPTHRHTPEPVRRTVLELRRKGLSSSDIAEALADEGHSLSARTVERILCDHGIGKLPRRTYPERGRTQAGALIPQRAAALDLDHLEPFQADCQVAGLFFFLPYILEAGIPQVIKKARLPSTSDLSALHSCLSVLALKLIGCRRLSRVDQYNRDQGLGLFAGLNVLPKPTCVATYSCRMDVTRARALQRNLIKTFMQHWPEWYRGETINLDFHTIPHWGEESQMEKVWCGTRNKALKGANTFFAQDGQSGAICYANADVLRKDGSDEVKHFVRSWIGLKGVLDATLVFDSRLTRYGVLGELDEDHIRFITLRSKNKTLLEETAALPDRAWERVCLRIPKRKHQRFRVHENEVTLSGCAEPFRQIILKDHGRATPTFVVTNNREFPLLKVVEVYAKRWRLENTLSELVDFFSLNALSSPIMLRIHFDALWTIVAHTLYKLLASDLRRFEHAEAGTLFRNFVDMPGRVKYDGQRFLVQIRKRAHTPLLKSCAKLQGDIEVPWLPGRPVRIEWRA